MRQQEPGELPHAPQGLRRCARAGLRARDGLRPGRCPSAAPQTAAPEAREKARAACAADVQKFCANIERAKGAMRGCLEAHDAQLSDGCKAARAERAAARAKEKG